MRFSIFKRKIQSVLEDNQLQRYSSKHKSGKLETRRLYKSPTSDKVFKRKTERHGKGYHVLFVFDLSGSMNGRDIKLGIEIIKDINTIYCDTDIVFFGYKTKHVSSSKISNISISNLQYDLHAGGNDLLLALNEASHFINSNTVIFVITDGGIRHSYSLDEISYDEYRVKLEDKIHSISKLNPLLGICLKDRYVVDFFQKYCYVNNIEEAYDYIYQFFIKNTKRL